MSSRVASDRDVPSRSVPPGWLLAGLWLGAADGALALWSRPEMAGPWLERALTLVLASLCAVAVLVPLRLLAWLPARMLSRRSSFSAPAWTDALAVCSLFGLLLLLSLERRGLLVPPGDFERLALLALAGLLPGLASAAALLALAGRLPAARQGSVARRGGLALWLACTLLVATLGWSFGGDARTDAGPNVILVSIDTLRADRLSAYGYRHPTSPNLDALAADGVLFETAYAQSNGTLPSHASILTGLDPLAHAVMEYGSRLAQRHHTLAERLQARGYRTAAWVGMGPNSFVGSSRQFDQGFELYEHSRHPRRFLAAVLPYTLDRLYRRFVLGGVGEARPQVDSVLRWLRGAGVRQPFFLFLHLYDVHSKFWRLPYEAPEPFRTRFCPGSDPGLIFDGCRPGGPCASRLLGEIAKGRLPTLEPAERELAECLYDGGIAFVDHELGRLLRELDRSGLAGRTIVVVTADHGEAFFEHGLPLHTSLYEHTTRVPLLVRGPGVARGRRVEEVAQGIDLLPTILELVGAGVEGPIQGSSLAPALRSEAALDEAEAARNRVADGDLLNRVADGDLPNRVPDGALPNRVPDGALPNRVPDGALPNGAFSVANPGLMSIRQGAFKYVQRLRFDPEVEGGRPAALHEELYDLVADPGERENLALDSDYEPVLSELRRALERRRRESLALAERWRQAGHEGIELGDEERRRLRALGYLE